MPQQPKQVTPGAGDCIVVYFLDEQPAGKRFAKKRNGWPLHVTIVTWFTADDESVVCEVLELSAAHSPALQLVLGDDVQFSPDTRVSVVANQSGVAMLHGVLLATLQENGITLRDAQWTDEHYTAHVTHHDVQPAPRVGDLLNVDCVSLVRLLPNNICEVVQHFQLGVAA